MLTRRDLLKTTALLAEWRTPSCCSESDLRAQVAQLLDTVASARKQSALARRWRQPLRLLLARLRPRLSLP